MPVTIEQMIVEGSCTAEWAMRNGYRWDALVSGGDALVKRNLWITSQIKALNVVGQETEKSPTFFDHQTRLLKTALKTPVSVNVIGVQNIDTRLADALEQKRNTRTGLVVRPLKKD